MTATLLDLLFSVFWPIALTGGIWLLAINAIAEQNPTTNLIDALTAPHESGASETLPSNAQYLRQRRNIESAERIPRRLAGRNGSGVGNHANGELNKGQLPNGLQLDQLEHQGSQPLLTRAIIARALVAGFLGLQLVSVTGQSAHAERFEFDQRRTEVRFVYKLAYSTQRGRFTKVRGMLEYDDDAPQDAKISASIVAASLTTGEALIDSELKGANFFNVERSPVIAFRSSEVRPLSATEADVLGEITVNGITRPVTLKVSLKPHDDPALKYDVGARKFIAKTRIQRSAFNMTDYKSMVDDAVDIEIAAIVRPR